MGGERPLCLPNHSHPGGSANGLAQGSHAEGCEEGAGPGVQDSFHVRVLPLDSWGPCSLGDLGFQSSLSCSDALRPPSAPLENQEIQTECCPRRVGGTGLAQPLLGTLPLSGEPTLLPGK